MMPTKKLKYEQALGVSAYSSLRSLFRANRDQCLEIEILPSAIQPPEGHLYLQDETNIGIPKQLLILAFPEARRIFTSCLVQDSGTLFDNDVRPPHDPVEANRVSLIPA
jgi:hypothetical protein